MSGASVAGLATAFWLSRSGWSVSLIERAPAFRDGGQNIDVRGTAREVLRRMDLFDAVAERNTTETGTVIVDGDGAVVAELPSDGPDGATAELEILRGDLARVILEALPEQVSTHYGDPIAQTRASADGVTITTESGRTEDADLLVVAEGVRSRTRDQVFGADVQLRELGITMAFGTIARTDHDDDRWRWYNAPGGRQVHLRPDNHGTTRAILAYSGEPDLAPASWAEALGTLRSKFSDAGWQAPRVLDGFAEADDVYVDDLAQVRMPAWHRDRVCVVGDSAWCVTPVGGAGTSLALTGAYVLAAQLAASRARGEGANLDVDGALQAYEAWMRPMVEDAQTLPPGLQRFAYPKTRAGLAVRSVALKVLTWGPVGRLMSRQTELAQTDQELPPVPSADPAGDERRC